MTDETKEIIGAVQEMFLDMKQEIAGVNRRLDHVEKELSETKQLATKTSLTLENEVKPQIQLLAEGYLPLTEKVDALAEDMDIVKFNVDIVKKVVTTHSKELDRLGRAK